MKYDVVIIGAGASGLMAATRFKNETVCIIDVNDKIGAKIKVSGGAKCNITNKFMSANKFLGDSSFIQKNLDQFNEKNLLSFLHQNGVVPNLNPKIVKGTYFCHSSSDVISMFDKLTQHCKFRLGTQVLDVEYDGDYTIKTNKGDIQATKLIVASGGLSYASLGASDIGFKIAEKFGHIVNKLNPALVGFTVQKDQFWFKELSGLSVDVKIKVMDKIVEGKMLFTHKGCSGPAILTTSLYWQKGNITLDFLPHKDSYLPKRFKQQIKDLDINLRNYVMAPAGNFGYTKAEVTKGGIDTAQIQDNFESKLQKNLYFIGEVLDVTGELGGYNFQWAFGSGYCINN
ncbi:NAD(P)/FAD-dependent oxidoreductase [Arcobacter sp. 15-2]|uniref:NAD(P)/FAD-dependent oxidoreductase n=1 Tax=Arcobacter sp. 15-2 TaxID=3374109 RepID=UPI00399CC624